MVKNVRKYSPTNLMLAAHIHYDNLCKVLLKGQEQKQVQVENKNISALYCAIFGIPQFSKDVN